MSLVIDAPDATMISERICSSEVGNIDGLLGVQEYESGAVIDQAEDSRSENLSILAHGNIKMEVQRGAGESTIHILKPGDILKIDEQAGICSSTNGSSPQTHATLYAVGDTKIINLDLARFEGLARFHPEIMHHVIQGLVRSVSDVLQSMSRQNEELRNYIYGAKGGH
jgi:CRP-like cAMP-binding protein